MVQFLYFCCCERQKELVPTHKEHDSKKKENKNINVRNLQGAQKKIKDKDVIIFLRGLFAVMVCPNDQSQSGCRKD